MRSLADVSYKNLEIGQVLYTAEDCGIDQSLIINAQILDRFEVDKDGLVWIHLHHRHNYEAWQRGEFHRVFLTKEEAIGYCEENNRAYSFLCGI
jgi:hypothetical protein